MIALLDKGFDALEAPPAAAPRTSQVASLARPVAKAEAQGDADMGTDVAVATPGTWSIQVGAFSKHDAAYDAAVRAVSKAPRQLEEGTVDVETVKGKKKTIFRARVIGIHQEQATKACQVLKKKGADCVAVRTRSGA